MRPKEALGPNTNFFDSKIEGGQWLDIELDVRSKKGFWSGFIVVTFRDENGSEIEAKKFRMFNHLTKHNLVNR